MKYKIVLLPVFLLLFFAGHAQKRALNSITENELKAHLDFIASDFLQGRDFGTPVPGLQIAAKYLSSECLKTGLTPWAANFSQQVEMISIQADSTNTFIRLNYAHGQNEFTSKSIIAFPGSHQNDTIKAPIVFAGYGYQNRQTGYDDFDGIDLTGKVVLIMTHNPEIKTDTSVNEIIASEMQKIARIFISGAKAIIYVPDPLTRENSWFGMLQGYASQGSYQLTETDIQNIPGNIVLANNQIANAILEETGNSLENIQIGINETGKPNSFDLLNVTAEIQLVKKMERVYGENIIAVVEGRDPKLKNECVVLTAHYDHIGISEKGEINNGADDNGSGTAVLLEIAQAFSKMKKKPRRSIVFAWVTAEEKGLVGSKYYTLNPFFPLENTILNINLDMVGRSAEKETVKIENPENSLAGPDGVYVYIGDKNPEIEKISAAICSKLGLIPSDALDDEFMNNSDQYNFYVKGIPVIGITTGLHDDYHKPGDDSDKIDYTKMKRIADFTFLVANEIANRKKRPTKNQDFENINLR